MQANGGHARKRAEQERDDRAAHDRHNQQTGAIAGERAQLGDAEGENTGKHDGIEEAHEDDAGHGDMAAGEHRGEHEGAGAKRGDAQDGSGFDFLQDCGTDEAANHGASPVISDKPGALRFRKISNFAQMKILNQESSDGDFRADIDKDPDHSEHEMAIFPQAYARRVTFLLGFGDGRQTQEVKDYGERNQQEADEEVWRLDRRSLLYLVSLESL